MTQLTPDLIAQLVPSHCQRIYIGYSGGVDSHVLLHLLASCSEIRHKLMAVYIHHGLQSVATDWGRHCQQQAHALGVDFQMIEVDASPEVGESPEAAAREARYAAFKQLIQLDELLMLAQHREDQLETLLLQLFRGAGLHGLASMPQVMAFGQGLVLRPLLDTAKTDILAYATHHQLQWIEDPTNQQCDYDRNYLRNQIIPLLKQRWPGIDKTVSRTAKHCADAGKLLDDWAGLHKSALIDPLDHSLLINQWQHYNENQRNWLLRCWLQDFGLKPSSTALLQAIITQVIFARTDANPQLHTQGWYIKKYKQKLYCVPGSYLHMAVEDVEWPAQQPALTLSNGYKLQLLELDTGIDQQLWQQGVVTVSFRRGGEKLKLPGRAGHHSLKKLFQEAEVPPWERNIRPLIYINGKLAAVAGLWVDEWAWRQQGACYALSWLP
jgi:tRNA(Ile)-lysidine synthase